MSATQKDIAEKAKVSRSLVGRVLSGDTSIRVSHSKRQHILNTAREIGYQPNLIARNLRRGKSNAVIAICQYNEARQTEDYTGGVLAILAAILAQVGYELKVRAFPNVADIMAGIEGIASASACDAAVLWLGNEQGDLPGTALEERGLPFVILGHHDETHPNWYQVDYNHALMMHQAAQSLVDLGRTRLAYFGFDTELNYQKRLRSGFQVAVPELTGFPVNEQWVYSVGFDHVVAEAVVDGWRRQPRDQQPTGIVIGAGKDAWLGIELALARQGRRIGFGPDDLAVAGQRPNGLPLLYGQGMAYENIDMSLLAGAAASVLKQQISGQGHPQKLTRLMPPLTSAANLQLPLPNRTPDI
ncbi:MAG: LacI family DNA-binding transcriptional regulator [Janthinobacterium lividum]